ncbi:hypothetical protein [Haliea sp. E17]|uniref:hypothetical protein n=1 Tax=Haliea sp. E17 TaxID=3401576 RepID=UPI003AAA7731
MTSTSARGLLCTLLLVAALAGCGIHPFRGQAVAGSGFLSRSISQSDGTVTVTAAVPDAAETEALTGLDLYAQGIQPVWLRVENSGDKNARVVLRSVDKDYFSPIEVAYMNRSGFSASGYADMERWFHDNGLRRVVLPGAVNSGLVFTHLKPGTKGFNLDIFSAGENHSFTFFVPMPGFEADYRSVDFAGLYPPGEIVDLDYAGLKDVVEQQLPCCANGPDQATDGGPLNVVMIATPLALRRALLRGDWRETRLDSEKTLQARQHQFRGRGPDGIFYLNRPDGNEQINLHLWLAPWRVEGQPVWVGQVYYREFEDSLLKTLAGDRSIRDSALLSRFMRESVAADIDSARRFLLQNLWYNQSLAGFGLVAGVGRSTEEQPLLTFDGVGYFTDGDRNVFLLSEAPVALDETRVLYRLELPSGVDY